MDASPIDSKDSWPRPPLSGVGATSSVVSISLPFRNAVEHMSNFEGHPRITLSPSIGEALFEDFVLGLRISEMGPGRFLPPPPLPSPLWSELHLQPFVLTGQMAYLNPLLQEHTTPSPTFPNVFLLDVIRSSNFCRSLTFQSGPLMMLFFRLREQRSLFLHSVI